MADSTISTSTRLLMAARRRRRPITNSATLVIMTMRTYAPTMPPISAGRYAGLRRAFAESGGPSSGEGAGSQSIPRGLSRVFMIVVTPEGVLDRIESALIAVSSCTRMVLHGSKSAQQARYLLRRPTRTKRLKTQSSAHGRNECFLSDEDI